MPTWAGSNPFAKADNKALAPAPAAKPVAKKPGDVTEDKTKEIKGVQQEGDDPLLQFDSLWQPNKDKDGKDIVPDNSKPKSYLPTIDSTKFEAMVGKMDFTRDFSPEEMEAFNGQDPAQRTAAFGSMMNKVARRAFSSSFAAANKIAEQGLAGARDRFVGEIPEHVRGMMTDSELSGSVSITSNPAFAPLVDNVKKQYLQKFPKATATQVNTAVKQYFDHLGAELNKKSSKNEDSPDNSKKLRQGNPDADFMEWISGEAPHGDQMFSDDSVEPQQ